MKRLLVAIFFILSVVAHADTLARVRMRVKLPFEPDNPSAVVLPVGTTVTVLWPQDGKLMVRYRRVEGLVPAIAIDYVASEHPGDVRQYRADPVPKESDIQAVPVAPAINTYHAPTSSDSRTSNQDMFGSLPVGKLLAGLGLVILVLILFTKEKKSEGNQRQVLRRQS